MRTTDVLREGGPTGQGRDRAATAPDTDTDTDTDTRCAQQIDLHRTLDLVDRVLTHEIAAAHARLDGRTDTGVPPPPDHILQCVAGGSFATGRWWEPLASLELSAAELAIVLFAVAPEASRRAGYQYSMLGDDPSQQWPSVDLLIRVLATDAVNAQHVRALLQPTGRLVALGVVSLKRLRATDSSLAATVHPAPWITARLLQLPDGSTASLRIHPPCDADALVGWFDEATLARLHTVTDALGRGPRAVLFVRSDREAIVAAAHHIAIATGRSVVEVDLDAVDTEESDELLDRARARSLLDGAVCVLRGDAAHRRLERFLGPPSISHRPPVLVAVSDWADVAAPVRAIGPLIDLPAPNPVTRWQGWVRALSTTPNPPVVSPNEVTTLAQRYELTRAEIDTVIGNAAVTNGTVDFHALITAAGTFATSVLDGIADRVPTSATWDDIVVPATTMDELRHVAIVIRHRDAVMCAHGVGNRPEASGAAVLFSGPSGTGKTLAAGVIAHELDADLYRVNLATVVSKYIGETEKNLERVFAAAQRCGAILLFDEADAIFGKRSEVRDAHDRYANLETAYLLQRIEHHQGAVILTTNVRHHLDHGFLRRFAAIVQFPEPSEIERHRLWDLLLGAAGAAFAVTRSRSARARRDRHRRRDRRSAGRRGDRGGARRRADRQRADRERDRAPATTTGALDPCPRRLPLRSSRPRPLRHPVRRRADRTRRTLRPCSRPTQRCTA